VTWTRSRAVTVGLAAVLGVATASCAGGHSATTDDIAVARLLDPTLGTPLPPVSGPTGPLSKDLAAQATTLPAGQARAYLDSHGYQAGYARVWQSGEEFVSVLGFQFFAPRDAVGLQATAFAAMADDAGYAPFDDPAIPGARAWDRTSAVSGRTLFCYGEWFTVDRYAVDVTHCAPFALSAPAITALALQERRYLLTAKG
jgi:hypothetical protein